MLDYSIKDLGYDDHLDRSGAGLSDDSMNPTNLISNQDASFGATSFSGGITDLTETVTAPQTFSSGAMSATINQANGVLYSGKTSFTDTTNGYRMGIDDSDNEFKFLMGTTGSQIDWNVTTADTLTISGAIAAGTIDIGGSDASSFHVDVDGNMWLGAATFATAPFSVSNAGALISTSATIAGWVISSTAIKDAAGVVGMSSAVTGGDDIRFWAGDTTPASAEFRVTEAGALTATSATITGAITASSGSIGSFTIGTYLYTGSKTAYNDTNAGVHLGSDGIGIGNNIFTVSSAGALVATSATITGSITATSGAIGGWTINATSITDVAAVVGLSSAVTGGDDIRFWAGHTTPASAPFYVTEAGALVATSATITGSITATTGTIGGWSITATTIQDAAGVVGMSSAVTAGDDIRFWAGNATPASAPFSVTEAGVLKATSATIGGWSVNATSIYTGTEDHSGYTANAGDITIYSDGSDASIHGKNFYIDVAGNLYCTSATVTGAITADTGSSIGAGYLTGTVAQANLNIANRGWTQTCVFSATDLDTVAWATGTFVSADGTSYSIGAGNTGDMAARTYIYLDIVTSTTAYQVTTTASTAVGVGKVLVATAVNGAVEPNWEVFGGIGGLNIDASSIVAGSITTNEIAATTITAANMNVSQLSGIAADLGSITAGTITLPSGGHIKSGQTAYSTGTGFYLGNDSSVTKFSIGDGGTSQYMEWDGTNLIVNGSTIRNQDLFGDGSDGDVTISGDTTLNSDMFYDDLTVNNGITLTTGGYRIFVKGILTNNGTIGRTGNSGGNGTAGSGTTAGAAGAAGAALADGSLKGGLAGIIGAAGANGVGGVAGSGNGNTGNNGSTGANIVKSLSSSNGSNGVLGGTGGNVTGRSGGSPGSVGTGGTRTGTVYNKVRSGMSAYLLYDFLPTGDNLRTAPSNGSGSSGGSGAWYSNGGATSCYSGGTGGSGGGGGNAGIVTIFARTIINAGTISSNGGVGGNAGTPGASSASAGGPDAGGAGGSGGSAGGNGGNGGVLIIVYGTLTNTGTIQAVGGAGGNKSAGAVGATVNGGSANNGTDGVDGATGNDGSVIYLQV